MPYRATQGGGGSDIRAPKIVVGNELAGDTASECDFLDPGDGSAITAALAALPASADLFIKAGLYDLSLGATLGFTVPAGRRVWAAGPSTAGTRILDDPANGNGGIFILSEGAELHDILIDVPPPTVANSGDGVVVAGKNCRLGNVTVDMNGASYVTANFTAQALRRSFSFGISGAGSEKTICQGCQATDLPRFYDEVGAGSEFGAYVTSDTPGSGLAPTKFIGCISDGGDVGYWVDATAGFGANVPIVVQACSAVNVSTYGVYLQEADFCVVGEAVLSLANDDPNVASAVRIEALTNAITGRHVISGITAILTSSSGPTGNAIIMVTTIGTSAGTVVTGSNLQGDWNTGILLGKSTTGNVVVGNAKASTIASGVSDQGSGNEIGSDLSLFKWNELDFTQFATTEVGSHIGTIVPSVVTVAGQPRIRFTLTGFRDQGFFEVLNLNLPRRYVVLAKFHVDTSSPSTSDNTVFLHTTNLFEGMTVATLFGVQFALGAAGSQYLIEAGVRVTAGTPSMTGMSVPIADIGIEQRTVIIRSPDPNVGDPEFTVHNIAQSNASSRQDAVGASQYTFAAGWGLTLDKFGIGMSTSNTKTGTVDISELEILKHPMDY